MKQDIETMTIHIPQSSAGSRIDVVLREVLKEYSRSKISQLIRDRFVLIDGMHVKPSYVLRGGEVATVILPEKEDLEGMEPQPIDLDIIYEDDDIIVLNKPAGLVVHPGAGVKSHTLVNGLVYYYKEISNVGNEKRPGIVHRLDKDTSGVMVVARNSYSYNFLVSEFQKRRVHKEYIALVDRAIKGESGMFSSSIGRHITNRVKISSKTRAGKEAVTIWHVMKRFKYHTLVRAEPKTGRTHQIRVHFSEAGHPVSGDRLYGSKSSFNVDGHKLNRHLLHAHRLSFKHPLKEKEMSFEASLPDDFKKILKLVGKDEL